MSTSTCAAWATSSPTSPHAGRDHGLVHQPAAGRTRPRRGRPTRPPCAARGSRPSRRAVGRSAPRPRPPSRRGRGSRPPPRGARSPRRRPGSDRICGPAASTTGQSARPQQCSPATAPPSTAASARDTRSSVSSTPSGKPGSRAAVRPGSSRNSTSVASGALARAAASTSPHPGVDRPLGDRERPVRGHADGVQRQAQRHGARELDLERGGAPRRGDEERPQAGERLARSMPPSNGASGSTAASSTSNEPSGSTRHPDDAPRGLGDHALDRRPRRERRAPPAASGWLPSASSTASSTSPCGRLPTADATPTADRSFSWRRHPRHHSLDTLSPHSTERPPTEIATGRR